MKTHSKTLGYDIQIDFDAVHECRASSKTVEILNYRTSTFKQCTNARLIEIEQSPARDLKSDSRFLWLDVVRNKISENLPILTITTVTHNRKLNGKKFTQINWKQNWFHNSIRYADLYIILTNILIITQNGFLYFKLQILHTFFHNEIRFIYLLDSCLRLFGCIILQT